jgi:hypothetical protein
VVGEVGRGGTERSAARREVSELAVASIVGSAAYNATATLGAAALVRPAGGVDVRTAAAVAAALPVGVLGVGGRPQQFGRVAGLVLVVGYARSRSGSSSPSGFARDSFIEIFASVVVASQLKGGADPRRDQRAVRLIGIACFGLALYMVQAAVTLATGPQPDSSRLGIGWLAASLVMLALVGGKARTGTALDNPVLRAEAKVTVVDGTLAAGIMAGVLLNALAGWCGGPTSPPAWSSAGRRATRPRQAGVLRSDLNIPRSSPPSSLQHVSPPTRTNHRRTPVLNAHHGHASPRGEPCGRTRVGLVESPFAEGWRRNGTRASTPGSGAAEARSTS